MLKDLEKQFAQTVWHDDVHKMGRSRQVAIYWARLIHLLIEDLSAGYLTQRAASLAYTSILTIVPLLAFASALLKGFGYQNKLQPLLFELLAPMGTRGAAMTGDIVAFVNNVRAGVLGSVGLALLLVTILSLTRKVETALNFVWRVREPRSVAMGFIHYLGVIMLGPVIVVLVAGITASFSSEAVVDQVFGWMPAGVLVAAAVKILSFLVIVATFAFLYVFVPFTHVRLRSALAGALLAGALWEISGWAFALLSNGTSLLTSVYAGFAILFIFFVWLYVSWIIVLVGTQASFYVQNPDLVRTGLRRNETGGRTFERVALHVMYLVGRSYMENRKPWSREQIARYLHLPTDIVLDVIDRLQHSGLIIRAPSRRNIHRYLPARDLDVVTLRDVMLAVRRSPKSGEDADRHIKAIYQVEDLMFRLDQAIDGVLGATTLRDFILAGEPADLSSKTVLRAGH